MSSPLSIAPGTVFAGDYRIERVIGQGGMGAIFAAEQLSTGKVRALKLMHPTLVTDDEHRRRFVQEARVGSRIASDHVVEVTAAGVDQATGAPFIVMELLEGETLQQRLRRAGAMPLSELRLVFEELCHAAAAAHTAGIVHRDLKPENVFLATTKRAAGPSFTVKVLDFGIAKLVAEAGTRGTTGAMGSPLWMAPEQTEVGTVTPAADVWALGLIAFYALTGTFFWKSARDSHATVSQLFREIVLEDIPPASMRGGGRALEGAFNEWFAKCVARDPALRYPDAARCWRAMQPVFGDAAPMSGEDAFAPTLVGGGVPSSGPMTPHPMTPMPMTPPAANLAPVAIPSTTAAPLAQTTPAGKSSSVGPWILGSAAVIALAIVGSVVAITMRAGNRTETAKVSVGPGGSVVTYEATRGTPSGAAPTPDPTPTPSPTPTLTPSPTLTLTPTPAPGSGAASAAAKPTPKASGGVGKVWSWKVSGHTVHVQSGAIKVDGNVPEDVVREAMDHDGWEYARCYEQVFKTADSMPHGTVTLTFKIFDQLPRNAAIEKSDFTVPAFNECVKNTALGQTANAAGASGFATVTYPLIFTVAD